MTKLYVGIDPGKNGAIVIIDRNLNIFSKTIMPVIGKNRDYDIQGIARWFKSLKEDHFLSVVLEKSLIVPMSGRISITSTHYCQGLFQGILVALEIPFEVVSPTEWKKKVLRGSDWKGNKGSSVIWCKRKWPQENWKVTNRCKKDHDGFTDAACIAYYGFLRESIQINETFI